MIKAKKQKVKVKVDVEIDFEDFERDYLKNYPVATRHQMKKAYRSKYKK